MTTPPKPEAPIEPYTVVLTSCGRFDLLERTLASLLPRLEGPVEEVHVIEDSGNRAVADVVRQFDGFRAPIYTMVNTPKLGQVRSIDRLYSRVETEWLFHCEDDWEFFGSRFISQSFFLLQEFPNFSMVTPRDPAGFHPEYFFSEQTAASGVRYRMANPARARRFAGLMFSPGLRRMREYRIVGPYARLSVVPTEPVVGRVYRELGYRVAALAEPAVRHIGQDRHVQIFEKPPGWTRRQIRSARKHWERLNWLVRPHSDPINLALRRQKLQERLEHNRGLRDRGTG
ncbi:MAG: glycosyltransferase family A protein [Rhodospirillaceae bacterium]|nr:glycosyltransferase family A protein [Rhodospirillaceae bacterium]